MPDGARCLLCGERGRVRTTRALRYGCGTERRFAFACPSCGLLSDGDVDPAEGRRMLDRLLAGPSFTSRPGHPFGLDVYTLRSAASAVGRAVEPRGADQHAALRSPHAVVAADANLVDLSDGRGATIAIGVLCRGDGLPAVVERLGAHRGWAAEIVVLSDGETRVPETLVVEGFSNGGARVLFRPLDGDFAAQRNVLQDACESEWVLQLDADESMDAVTGTLLPMLAARCETEDVVSIGLRRRNRVDGALSDLFPDVQYRLNRRAVRYSGRVHERPVRDWPQSMIALHGAIEHELSAEHVRTRSARYEAIDPGRGRLEEADRLLSPYRP